MTLLNALTAEPALFAGFVSSLPICIRHASIFVKFLNALCGPKRNSFKVKDPMALGFDSKKMFRTTASVFLRLGGSADFRWAVGKDAVSCAPSFFCGVWCILKRTLKFLKDYDPAVMSQLVQISQRIGDYEVVGLISDVVRQSELSEALSVIM